MPTDQCRRFVLLSLLGLMPVLAAGQTVQQQIDAIFDALPGFHTLGGRVESEDGSVVYYTRDAGIGKIPASVTKSFVVGASMAVLGTDHQFVTRVYRDGTIDGSGVLNGDLILLGNHDFTWATDYYPGNARYALDRLAEELYNQGLRGVTGTVRGYGYLMYAEVPSNSNAVNAFRDALVDTGIAANATATSFSFNPPGVAIAEWRSMPLSQACRDLMKVSDNDDSQALMRHLAYEMRGVSADSVGEDIIQDWLASTGVDMSGNVLLEGAGLSRSNRVSALQAVGLTRTMLRSPEGWWFAATLPIGGRDGTLGGRYFGGNPAFGRVHAKTGTLSGVLCLSGYVVNPIDHQRYLFAFLMNDVSGFSNSTGRTAIDNAVGVLAGNVQGLAGSVPGDVTLLRAIGDPISGTASLAWTAASSATSYNVYSSATGSTWAFAANTSSTSITVGGLQFSETANFMVRAVNGFGESKPSDAYAVRITNTPYRVLVVDGNDRWERNVPENDEELNHEFALQLSESVTPAVAIDSCVNEQIASGSVDLADYDAVLWLLGEESTFDETFSTTEQFYVRMYLDGGGNLFVSGAEIGWDLDWLGSASDASFYNTYLKANYVADSAGTQQFFTSGGIFATLPQLWGRFHPTWMEIDFPDVIAPLGGAVTNLEYISDAGLDVGAAGIEFDGPFRIVNLGFPFESIAQLALRRAMMNRVLSFFLDTEFPDDVLVEARDLSGAVLGPPTITEVGLWLNSTIKSLVPEVSGTGSRFNEYLLPNSGTDRLIITPDVPVTGRYEIFVTWGLGANCFDAQYTIRHASGSDVVLVDQIPLGTPGENTHKWVSLGEYEFNAGFDSASGSIELSEEAISGRPTLNWNQRVYFDALKMVLREKDPITIGDFDRDGDVDGDDLDAYAGCALGPLNVVSTPCRVAFDADGDDDIDINDFAAVMMVADISNPSP